MNTVGAATAIAGQYTYVRIYTCIMLFYTYAVYILCMHERKKSLCQDHENKASPTQFSQEHCTKYLAYKYVF